MTPLAAPDAVVVVLDSLHAQGLYVPKGERNFYYDTPTFAEPDTRTLADASGIQWLDNRLARARNEEDGHQRLRQYAVDADAGRYCRLAAVLVAGAVGAGLSGGLNFGVFALVVAQVSAAMNHSPAGIAVVAAGRFSASAAGRQVALNLLGALPGAVGYAIAGGVSAVLLRPLIDAVALLLSHGRLTPVVPVDPALAYPEPSPVDERGHPVEGVAYLQALALNAHRRAAMSRRQSRMMDAAERFNLKFGTPLFAVCHAVRLMYQTALLVSQGKALAATAGGGLSAMASACASACLHLSAGTQRLGATTQRASGARLPLFVPRADLAWLRGDPRPSLALQIRQGFMAAYRGEVREVGLARRLVLALPANALAVYGATAFINVMIPLGTLLADQVRSSPPGAIAVVGAVALVAFMLSYWSVCKALRLAAQAVQRDPGRHAEHRATTTLVESLPRLSTWWPRPMPMSRGIVATEGQHSGRFDAERAVVVFDAISYSAHVQGTAQASCLNA